MDVELLKNLRHMCRLCLVRDERVVNIFDDCGKHGYIAAEVIVDLLRFQVQQADGYPEVVCYNCIDSLTDFKVFKDECIERKNAYYSKFLREKCTLGAENDHMDEDVKSPTPPRHAGIQNERDYLSSTNFQVEDATAQTPILNDPREDYLHPYSSEVQMDSSINEQHVKEEFQMVEDVCAQTPILNDPPEDYPDPYSSEVQMDSNINEYHVKEEFQMFGDTPKLEIAADDYLDSFPSEEHAGTGTDICQIKDETHPIEGVSAQTPVLDPPMENCPESYPAEVQTNCSQKEDYSNVESALVGDTGIHLPNLNNPVEEIPDSHPIDGHSQFNSNECQIETDDGHLKNSPTTSVQRNQVRNSTNTHSHRKKTNSDLLQILNTYTFEKEYVEPCESNSKVFLAKLVILRSLNIEKYFGELYVNKDYRNGQQNGSSTRFSIGSRFQALIYVEQFKKIFNNDYQNFAHIPQEMHVLRDSTFGECFGNNSSSNESTETSRLEYTCQPSTQNSIPASQNIINQEISLNKNVPSQDIKIRGRSSALPGPSSSSISLETNLNKTCDGVISQEIQICGSSLSDPSSSENNLNEICNEVPSQDIQIPRSCSPLPDPSVISSENNLNGTCNPKEQQIQLSIGERREPLLIKPSSMNEKRMCIGSSKNEKLSRRRTDVSTNSESLSVRHQEDRKYFCKICDKGFNHRSNLYLHLKCHTDKKPFECNFCDKKFKLKHHLTHHLNKHNTDKPFKCEVCGKSFNKKCILIDHQRLHSAERNFKCPLCEKLFLTKSSLNSHVKYHTQERKFECNVCSFKFHSRSDLVKHSTIHTGERAYKCTVCGKAFRRISSRNIHAKIHLSEKPYTCYHCNKGFYQKSALRYHIQTHLNTDSRIRYPCSICGNKYLSKYDTKKHIKRCQSKSKVKAQVVYVQWSSQPV